VIPLFDLEHVSCRDLTAGAEVIQLHAIDPKALGKWNFDVPEEYSVFMEEEFATFDMGNSVTFFGDECVFNSMSHLPRECLAYGIRQSWVLIGACNIEVRGGESRLQAARGTNSILCAQDFDVKLLPKTNMGYLQLLACPHQFYCDGRVWHRNDVLTVYFFRNQRVKQQTPTPALVTFRPYEHQNVVPVQHGQYLQLVTSADSVMEIGCEEMFESVDQRFIVIDRERLKIDTLLCKQSLNRVETIFVTCGKSMMSVLLPCVEADEEDRMYASILQPVTKAVVLTSGLAGINVTVSQEDNWVVDDTCMEVHYGKDEVHVGFLLPVESITLERSNGYWWVFTNKETVGGKI